MPLPFKLTLNTREKYRQLMAEIADLELRVEDLEAEQTIATESPDRKDADIVRQELEDLRNKLAAKRNELTRLSDGCGRPHPQS